MAVIKICQCSENCHRPPLDKEPFCEYHTTHGCPNKSKLTGYEPSKEIIKEYNKDPAKRKSHNCYAFAVQMNDLEKIRKCRNDPKCDVGFHAPGKQAGQDGFSGILGKRCGDILSRTKGDIPEATLSIFDQKCPPGFSKIAVVVDDKRDFHYYIQLDDGTWAHKPGGRKATLIDSNGSVIINPKLAGRHYPAEYPGDSELNYSSFCSFLCVPRTKPIIVKGGTRKHYAPSKPTVLRAKTRRVGSLRRVKKGSRSVKPRRNHI